MPARIRVHLAMLSGVVHSFRVRLTATILDLRRTVQRHLQISRSRTVICLDSRMLDDATPVAELIDWLVITDLINPRVYLDVEVLLHAAILTKLCARCGGDACKRCSRCLKVRYCSQKCQQADWRFHKLVCSTAL